jgi:hypothetical protein
MTSECWVLGVCCFQFVLRVHGQLAPVLAAACCSTVCSTSSRTMHRLQGCNSQPLHYPACMRCPQHRVFMYGSAVLLWAVRIRQTIIKLTVSLCLCVAMSLALLCVLVLAVMVSQECCLIAISTGRSFVLTWHVCWCLVYLIWSFCCHENIPDVVQCCLPAMAVTPIQTPPDNSHVSMCLCWCLLLADYLFKVSCFCLAASR